MPEGVKLLKIGNANAGFFFKLAGNRCIEIFVQVDESSRERPHA
jgi:hypothetical protein